MRFELCKGKTKCKDCGDIMKKNEIRGVFGSGSFYDPQRYLCVKCCKGSDINIKSLIKVHKQLMKYHEDRVNKLKAIQKNIYLK